MNGPIRRLAVGMFSAFAVLLVTVTWYQVVRADDLKGDPLNPRPALSERGKERGLIITSDGLVVARSVESAESKRSFTREYPAGEAFAHVVGYTSFIFGDTGIEGAYASSLRSRRDLTISDLLAAILGQDLRPLNVELTIDSVLQQAAVEALGDQRGAIVALDPATGAVLAAVSTPSFDPVDLIGDDAAANWEAYLNDPGEPFRDRATRELYAPGSTFKVVVAATAQDVGLAGPGTTFDDPRELALPGSDATISNFDGGPCNDGESTTLLNAFVRSCNTVFGDLAMQLGAEEIGVTASSLGFNRQIEYPWSVPEARWQTEELVDDAAALAQSGIGERDVRATPLHMAMIAAAVANEGVAVSPYLVKRVFDAGGDTTDSTDLNELGRAMSANTAQVLTQMMERVVTSGTGRRAAVPGVRVAGKTGTATGTEGFSNLWFIGFAPVDRPTIALAVFIEGSPMSGESATGGSLAAPIAAALIQTWLSTHP
ncbi:MAG: penicillin-binding transpeptidase domain-containing protein [Acidimicrobiia bacterium]|nr:penicillin-binding transpeptidase domain-containing protein [Acidimicrobiia bacterium]